MAESDLSNSTHVCQDGEAEDCFNTCTTFLDCSACQCVATSEESGPWGSVVDVVFCLFPVVFLVYVTVKSNPLPTASSLPLSALLLYLIRLMYLGSDPLLVTAAIVKGLHEALTPLSIMSGAILLFETMESTLCLPYLMSQVKTLTEGHAVAESMLIFAFCYTVEGASGFGTPAALGAPLLVSSGHDPLASVVVLLIFNTTATIFGAVGTPIWFGFGQSITDDSVLLAAGEQAAVTMGIVAFIIVPWVLTLLVSFQDVLKNLGFIFISLLTTIGPAVAIAFFNYEFPTLIGGIVGCLATSVFIKFKLFLVPTVDQPEERDRMELGPVSEHSVVYDWKRAASSLSLEPPIEFTEKCNLGDPDPENGGSCEEGKRIPSQREYLENEIGVSDVTFGKLIARSFPIWGSVLLLLLTRLEQLGIKSLLQAREPSFKIQFGSYGTFRLSASLVFQLENILSYPNISWKFELLYVPFLLPFILVSTIAYLIFRKDCKLGYGGIIRHVLDRLQKPAIALMGALVLVQLMILQGNQSPAYLIGSNLSSWLRQGFIVVSPLLGALGSFFSGSTTVSNLTFAQVQAVAADAISLPVENLLALQVLGATAGNGICCKCFLLCKDIFAQFPCCISEQYYCRLRCGWSQHRGRSNIGADC